MFEIYLAAASLTFLACLFTGHEEYFESWFDHGLQAFMFAVVWPASLGLGFCLCMQDWLKKRKKRRE